MSLLRTATLAALAVVGAWSLVSQTARADELKRQFLEQYKPREAALRDFYHHARLKTRVVHQTRETREFHQSYETNGPHVRVQWDRPSGSKGAAVAAPDQSFGVSRGATESEYKVTGFKPYDQQVYSLRLDAKAIFAPYCIYETSVSEYLADPAVNITEPRELTEQGERLLRLRFSEQIANVERRGVIDFLLPSYALRRYRFDNRTPSQGERVGSLRGETDYEPSDGDFPLPKRIHIWSESQDPGVPLQTLESEDFLVESFEHTKVPLSEFKLTAFGLPEPGGRAAVGASSWTRFLLVNAGIVVAALVVLIWRWRR